MREFKNKQGNRKCRKTKTSCYTKNNGDVVFAKISCEYAKNKKLLLLVDSDANVSLVKKSSLSKTSKEAIVI